MKNLLLSLIALLLINYTYANDTLVIKTSIQNNKNYITLNINFKHSDTVTKVEKPEVLSNFFSNSTENKTETESYNKDSISKSFYNGIFINKDIQPYIYIPENIQKIIDLIKDEKDKTKAYNYLLSDNKYSAIRVSNTSNLKSINNTTYRNIEFNIEVDIKILKNNTLTIEPILINLFNKKLYTNKIILKLEN